MTKGDLVTAISEETGLTKTDTEKTINVFIETVKNTLKKGGDISLVGFGTFSTSKRKARMGRNPQTGEEIKIAAAIVPKFKAGKGLKDAVKK